MERARAGEVTDEIREVAKNEGLAPEELARKVAKGAAIIIGNRKRKKAVVGVGDGLKTKINVNIGTSKGYESIDYEIEKAKIAIRYGADTIMDLSTAGEVDEVLKAIIDFSNVPVGTVPIYQSAVNSPKKRKSFLELSPDDFIEEIAKQAEMGVDFMTVHAGITYELLEMLRRMRRTAGVVSRGGGLMLEWIGYNKAENPLYEMFDEILKIAKEYEVVLSLGDGLRPGAIADSTDRAQITELIVISELVESAWEKGVQVMVEGPGHIPLHQVVMQVQLEKALCKGAPFYVLGPIVTDIAPGYDHIASAIGAAVAGMVGADILCDVSPSEHLAIPTVEDIKEATITYKIAAHAADIAKRVKGADERDRKISEARRKLDWDTQFKLAIDPERARKIRELRVPKGEKAEVCSMCGDYCPLLTSKRIGI